ncbi:hypothetical protein DFO67_108160 [Modicisalibacter xianhensis]|uniref:Uncharacterized protein n=2 Tax=Modicisalibacter xianhensis TaxID=442341 RepID=A0A4R8G1Y5_9GAMM|nr:hypothetical protein DFO67_108160 [Halomonas xianhensis]
MIDFCALANAGALCCGAFSVPPFLPNLTQDLIILEQSTNWWSVGIGAGATLAGAAIGASLGAYFSYQATRMANQEHLKREQLEKIFIEAWSCRRNLIELHRDTNAVYRAKSGTVDHLRTLHELADAIGPKIDDLVGLQRIYLPQLDDASKKFLMAAHAFMNVSIKVRLKSANFHEPDETLIHEHDSKLKTTLASLEHIYDPLAKKLRDEV